MEVTGILGLLLLAAIIYAILKIAQSGATTGVKVIWILVVLLFPVLGLIIWFLFGPGGNKK
jgi:hypothetical protein